MTDTPKEQKHGTDVETDRQEHLVDGSLILAGFPTELLVALKSEVPLSRIIFDLYLSPLAMWAKGTMYQVDNPWCVRFW